MLLQHSHRRASFNYTVSVGVVAAADTMPVIKKPATHKKPATNGTPLTESALTNLENASDSRVESFLEGLNNQASQQLWKKFERGRMEEGADGDQWRKLTNGPGRNKNSRNLLKVWIQGGLTTNSKIYQESTLRLESKKTKGQSEQWQPLHYMLTHKYGPKELKARVQAGTIAIRQNPRDPRFPEFQEVTEFSSTSFSKTGTLELKPSKTQALSWSDFDQLQQLDVTDPTKHGVSWGNVPPPNADPLQLTGCKGLRDGTPSPSPTRALRDAPSDAGKGSRASGKSAASAILANIANCESLVAKKSPQDVRIGLVKCKGVVDNLINTIQEQEAESTGKMSKKTHAALKELGVVKKILEKPKVNDLKPGAMEKLVKKSSKLCRKYSSCVIDG